MAWYYGNFNCGCDGRVNIIGPTKDRQYKADRRFDNLCESCYQQSLIEQNRASEKQSLKLDLPSLIGTEKQVSWANTIRVNFYTEIMQKIDNKETQDIADNFFLCKLDSKYWIDSRHYSVQALLEEILKLNKETKETAIMQALENEVITESTVSPSMLNYAGVVKIEYNTNEVRVIYEKNKEFRQIVKSLGFRWNLEKACWIKTIIQRMITSEDRVAELGNILLNEGFCRLFKQMNWLW